MGALEQAFATAILKAVEDGDFIALEALTKAWRRMVVAA